MCCCCIFDDLAAQDPNQLAELGHINGLLGSCIRSFHHRTHGSEAFNGRVASHCTLFIRCHGRGLDVPSEDRQED